MYLLNRRNAFRQSAESGGQSTWIFDLTKSILTDKASILYTNAQGNSAARADHCTQLDFINDGSTVIFRSGTYLYRNNLETPWDITSLTRHRFGEPPRITSKGNASTFSRNGQVLTTDCQFQWKFRLVDVAMEAPYNIESIVEVRQDDVRFPPMLEDSAQSIQWGPDGKKIFVLTSVSDMNLTQYTLDDAWDLGTASYATMKISMESCGLESVSFFRFSPDGYRLIVASKQWLYDFNLNIPWDIRTLKPYHAKIDTGFSPIDSFAISPDQNWLYLFDSTTNNVHQYELHR